MKSERYLQLLDYMEQLHERKNAGYAGHTNDPWSNFRLSESFGVSAFKGVLVRLSDKYARVVSLTNDMSNEQVGEGITDTLIDLAAYALIAVCLWEEEHENNIQ